MEIEEMKLYEIKYRESLFSFFCSLFGDRTIRHWLVKKNFRQYLVEIRHRLFTDSAPIHQVSILFECSNEV